MNFQAIVLVTAILAAVAAFTILPALYGRHAKHRRRKAVAFDERRQSVDLFKSADPAPPSE
jgi:hypothetical protein